MTTTPGERASAARSAGTFAALIVACAASALAGTQAAASSFVNFETGQVRPLALSPDQSRLFAINTPDNRLEIFDVDAGGLTHAGSVPVGLEPIAVAARNDSEVWVVNHLSDSISIVDVAADPPRVRQTINTCDEPRDIVFAGPDGDRAFVTAARRGRACPVNADSTTPGIGRAIVQVWNAGQPGNGINGNPLTTIVLFGDTPRALARSADGNTVYAAVFHSGNQTTTVRDGLVCDTPAPCVRSGISVPGGIGPPFADLNGAPAPRVGVLVKFDRDSQQWLDDLGRDWTDAVAFDLPDLDVFAIDAAADVPVETQSFPHVGTVLFNMATNPGSGKVYVSNTEARNEVRFEGPGIGHTTVQGKLHQARITVIDGATVTPRHLNKHIDYAVRPAPPGVGERSLATPLEMAVTADGSTLYVAAFGSSKIGVFDTAALEADTFVPDAASHIVVGGGGPTGIVLDEARGRLYALTRFDNAITIVGLASRAEEGRVALYNPEPAETVAGRPMLYDAAFTSSNGEASCSSCHIFGDFDSLAWDLGDPSAVVLRNPIPTRIGPLNISGDFHPLKGPMTTQSLRGMAHHGSMHWRGDRTGGNDPDSDPFDEVRAFEKFNPAFVGLVGRETEIAAADMRAFADFILGVTYPPNPIRRLDNALGAAEQEGRDIYFGPITDVLFNCNGCHALDPTVNATPDGSFSPETGFFGSDGFSTFEGETQMFKITHLRNVYQKVGMFGLAPGPHMGPQVRGYGVLHDGSIDTIFNFLSASVFSLSNAQQNRLQRFVLAFDSNLAPIVGHQVTLSETTNNNSANNRVTLLGERAGAGECDVVVRAVLDGEARGGLRLADGSYQLDREAEPPVADADLRASAILPGQAVTFTCVPPGSGQRIGLDRDEDGFFDRDEIDAGADPADADSFPITTIGIRTAALTLRDDRIPPFNPNQSRIDFRSGPHRGEPSGVVVPAPGSVGDPTTGGANGGGGVLTVYRTDGGGGTVSLDLPAARWTRTTSGNQTSYRYRDSRREDGPITAVMIRNGTLTIRGNGPGMFQLDDAPQGEIALTLRLGGELELCAVAPARAPATTNDTRDRFRAERNVPAPVECPAVP